MENVLQHPQVPQEVPHPFTMLVRSTEISWGVIDTGCEHRRTEAAALDKLLHTADYSGAPHFVIIPRGLGL